MGEERRDKAPDPIIFTSPLRGHIHLVHTPPHTHTCACPSQATQELKEKARDDAKAALAAGGVAPVGESVDDGVEAAPVAAPEAKTSAAEDEAAPAVVVAVAAPAAAAAAPVAAAATAPADAAAATGPSSTLQPAAAATDASGAVATVDAAAAAAAALQTAKHTALDFNAEEKPLSTFMLVSGGEGRGGGSVKK